MRSIGLFVAVSLLCGAHHVSAEPVPKPLPWVQLSEIYYTPSQSRMYGYNTCADATASNAIFMETNFDGSCGPHTQGVWMTVDLTPLGVAPDAAAAFLSGMIIVTHWDTIPGTPTPAIGTADIHVSLRPFGSTEDPGCNKYLGQATTTIRNENVRSNFSTWVALSGGKFQWCYRIPNPAPIAAYGVNMSVQAWGRAAAAQPLGLMATTVPKKRTPAPKKAVKGWCLGTLCLQ